MAKPKKQVQQKKQRVDLLEKQLAEVLERQKGTRALSLWTMYEEEIELLEDELAELKTDGS